MAFPKKYTRKITVNDQTYLWHLNENSIDFEEYHITIRHEKIAGQILYLDLYSWHLSIRPRTIREAILWALENGWEPKEKGKPIYVGYPDGKFQLLPEGIRFAYQMNRNEGETP